MSTAWAWFKSDALAAKALRTFIYTFVAVILTAWYSGAGDVAGADSQFVGPNITSLADAFSEAWNFAAGTAFVAAIGTLGLTGLLQRGQ